MKINVLFKAYIYIYNPKAIEQNELNDICHTSDISNGKYSSKVDSEALWSMQHLHIMKPNLGPLQSTRDTVLSDIMDVSIKISTLDIGPSPITSSFFKNKIYTYRIMINTIVFCFVAFWLIFKDIKLYQYY